MKIASITAGAAGMYCGSCLRDNTLAAALVAQGHDALLIPTYTPIRTDEEDVSQKRVFFGGINVYLQQKAGLFRRTPRWLDRLLDFPGLLRLVSGFAVSVRAEDLGALTVSMLEGSHGRQAKEVANLIDWLERDFRPDVVLLTNVLLSGVVPELRRRLKVPVVATLQGDDIFLESLPAPARQQAIELIRENCREIAGFIATCAYYADFMAEYLGLQRERFHVVYPGLKLGAGSAGDLMTHPGASASGSRDAAGRPVIGYFARIAPEKGLHRLVDAFIRLRKSPGAPPAGLRFSGWLGEHNKPYLAGIRKTIADAGLSNDVEHVDSPTHADKVRFLQSVDVLSVPTPYREPKGLYVLEALAHGVPVVQPRHGSFPELIERTGGGLLVAPDDPDDLAAGLRRLLEDEPLRRDLGRKGQAVVHEYFTAERMASDTVEVLGKYL